VNSLVSASNIAVPQIRLGVEKHWWTPELSDLKQQCIELTGIWRQHRCPRSGPINRVKVKLRYKCAIKETIISADEEFNEVLFADPLCSKDFASFWKSCRRRFCSQNIKPTRMLNKRSGDLNILDEFTSHYSKVGQTITLLVLIINSKLLFPASYRPRLIVDCIVMAWLLMYMLCRKKNELKLRKAAGHDTIQSEHIVFAGYNLAVHLSLLFTGMVRTVYLKYISHRSKTAKIKLSYKL